MMLGLYPLLAYSLAPQLPAQCATLYMSAAPATPNYGVISQGVATAGRMPIRYANPKSAVPDYRRIATGAALAGLAYSQLGDPGFDLSHFPVALSGFSFQHIDATGPTSPASSALPATPDYGVISLAKALSARQADIDDFVAGFGPDM